MGFLSGLGNFAAGAGQAAGEYGQQVRGFLHQNRNQIADWLHAQAAEEEDPTRQAELRQHAADVLTKPMGQNLLNFSKTLTARIKDANALHQGMQNIAGVMQPPPAQPKQAPGPVPAGQVAGGGGNAAPKYGDGIVGWPSYQSAVVAPAAMTPPPIAAAPATPAALPEDVAPLNIPGFSAPGLPGIMPPPPEIEPAVLPVAPPVAGPLPVAGPSDLAEQEVSAVAAHPALAPVSAAIAQPSLAKQIDDLYIANTGHGRVGATPAARRAMAPYESAIIQHHESLTQAQDLRKMDLGERQAALREMEASPEWKNVPDIVKAQYRLWSHSQNAQIPSGAGMYQPRVLAPRASGIGLPEDAVDSSGAPVVRDGSVEYRIEQRPGMQPEYYRLAPALSMVPMADGTMALVSKTTPGVVAGAVPQSTLTPRVFAGANGQPGMMTYQDLKKGGSLIPVPGAVTPSMLATESSKTISPSGETHSQSRKVAPAGFPAAGSQTPVPKAVGAPAIPKTGPLKMETVRPLNTSDRTDALALLMAKDSAAAAKLMTNAADKVAVGNRMAQLGLTPGMITTSMRERAKNARLILSHMDEIDNIIKDAEKQGELGVVATRWNDFLTNKVGKDETKSQVFSKLSSELGFLSTAVSMAHGGLRGGSSPTMVEHWEKALDAKDPTTLRAKLGEAKKWMQGYAKLDDGMANEVPPVTGNDSGVTELERGPDGKLRIKK